MRAVAATGAGRSMREAAAGLGCAPATVSQAVRRYCAEGIKGLFDRRASNGCPKVDSSFLRALKSTLTRSPQDFGWMRTTWTRELLALEMKKNGLPAVAVCTVGRALARIGARLGMARPYVRCPWPRNARAARLAQIAKLVRAAPADEPVYFEDEVDIHLNPKIGRDWMLRGQQRRVLTPGKNRKHYLAGALCGRTNTVVWVDGGSKSSELFIRLVFKLMALHRKARRVHLILDNYGIHSSKRTNAALAQFGRRLMLHFLPPYCPDANRIERLWRDVHANVTRNHRRRTIHELLDDVNAFLDAHNAHAVGKRAAPSLARAA